MSSLLRDFVKIFLEGVRKMDRLERLAKLAKVIEDTWISIYNVAHEVGLSSSELEHAEVLFKFANNVLQDIQRIMDSKFTISFYKEDNEMAIGATFDGVHLHTVFLSPDTPLEKIREEFVKPEIAVKAAINLFIEGLEEVLYKFKDWRRVNC
jgi:hypothetical protein